MNATMSVAISLGLPVLAYYLSLLYTWTLWYNFGSIQSLFSLIQLFNDWCKFLLWIWYLKISAKHFFKTIWQLYQLIGTVNSVVHVTIVSIVWSSLCLHCYGIELLKLLLNFSGNATSITLFVDLLHYMSYQHVKCFK